mmetsp:Transcript_80846/g.249436  ORF Transcript_80846/g.249436 Transcript_80846/m.249436 type:complete len:336 (+) Transcript_80846:462-1469(+)
MEVVVNAVTVHEDQVTLLDLYVEHQAVGGHVRPSEHELLQLLRKAAELVGVVEVMLLRLGLEYDEAPRAAHRVLQAFARGAPHHHDPGVAQDSNSEPIAPRVQVCNRSCAGAVLPHGHESVAQDLLRGVRGVAAPAAPREPPCHAQTLGHKLVGKAFGGVPQHVLQAAHAVRHPQSRVLQKVAVLAITGSILGLVKRSARNEKAALALHVRQLQQESYIAVVERPATWAAHQIVEAHQLVGALRVPREVGQRHGALTGASEVAGGRARTVQALRRRHDPPRRLHACGGAPLRLLHEDADGRAAAAGLYHRLKLGPRLLLQNLRGSRGGVHGQRAR